MTSHKKTQLGFVGRVCLVQRVLEFGWIGPETAAAYHISERTVLKWMARDRAGVLPARRDASSHPHGSPLNDAADAAPHWAPHCGSPGSLDIVGGRCASAPWPCPHASAGASLADCPRHLRTPQYVPRTIRKAERFIQTTLGEWAYVKPHCSSAHLASVLAHFLTTYNTIRPLSANGYMSPASRLSPITACPRAIACRIPQYEHRAHYCA